MYMIRNIQNYDNDDLIEIAHQIATELSNRSDKEHSLEVSEVVDIQEYSDVIILDIETFSDEFFTITFTKEQIIELRNRLNQTNY